MRQVPSWCRWWVLILAVAGLSACGPLSLGLDSSEGDFGVKEKGDSEEFDEGEEPEEPEEPETYLGGWVKASCADHIEGTGNKAGEIAHDFVQMDQNGEMLRLYDFCDRAVLLVGAAFW